MLGIAYSTNKQYTLDNACIIINRTSTGFKYTGKYWKKNKDTNLRHTSEIITQLMTRINEDKDLVAKILKEVFPSSEIYRAGGDEFMVLLRDTTKNQLEEYAKQMKEEADKTDSVSFAIGTCVEENSQNIYEAMKNADVNMYEDKKIFYEQHPERKVR